MRIEPDIAGTQIVLLGSFNPAIFTPAWFARHGILSETEADSAELQFVHNLSAVFQVEWFHLEVRPERFSIETTRAPYVRIRDLVIRVFGELLPHTPTTAIGINNSLHVKARSKAEWNRICATLAPPAAWGPWRDKLDLDGESGGMMSLTMSQLSSRDRPEGSAVNITVEPSTRVGQGQLGVFVGINHHFSIGSGPADSDRTLQGIFDQYFDSCVGMSNEIFDHVMSLGHENQG